MVKFGKQVAKHKVLVVLVCILLLIPSVFGYMKTRINYDLLSYLPNHLETVAGQDIMVDEFGMGAFSMVIVEGMENKDVAALKEKIEAVDHVSDVLWVDDLTDITFPVEMFPDKIRNAFFNGDATMMVALFDNTTSSDDTMQAITEIRHIASGQCFASGMSGVVTDIKELSLKEMPIYVMIAVILSLIVLGLTMESFLIPVLFLISIGFAIIYNLGTNLFLGEISYITQALTAVLQLGVTMDYSIFLLNSYEENKQRFPGEKNRAMAHAISNTFKSVIGSSVTTVAGFIALCFMTFTLGRNIGIVMAKGVVIGVLCCIVLLPALILLFDKPIEKTKHKSLIPKLDGVSAWITKHNKVFVVLFLLLLFPAIYGNNHTAVYYNIDQSLPQDLESAVANKKLEEEFNMNTVHMVLLENGMSAGEKEQMLRDIEQVDGVKWALGLNSLIGASVPEEMIPKSAVKMLKSDNYEIEFICSNYKTATEQVNQQIGQINDIVKTYSPNSMVIGEAPLTKDLEDITEIDFLHVNALSIAAIFIIIMIVFKSISLPVILVAVIEFAICVNMAVPFYTHTELPFVASIVIGTVQLGATVDYAILMTSRYQKERSRGLAKKEAIGVAHKLSMKSILISGLTFFAATFGVGLYSQIDMISSLCTLLSRGAVISTLVVICVLPALLLIFDPVIVKTSYRFLNNGKR
ncbi:MAG: MMPL family transporter [Lachnospiraceae bacterium]|nr:MMPL family transporter [Lachnospiraceae bacterium]